MMWRNVKTLVVSVLQQILSLLKKRCLKCTLETYLLKEGLLSYWKWEYHCCEIMIDITISRAIKGNFRSLHNQQNEEKGR